VNSTFLVVNRVLVTVCWKWYWS